MYPLNSAPCSPKIVRRFAGIYSLHVQDRNLKHAKIQKYAAKWAYSSTLMMKAIYSSETSMELYRTTERYNLRDGHHCKNLQSIVSLFVLSLCFLSSAFLSFSRIWHASVLWPVVGPDPHWGDPDFETYHGDIVLWLRFCMVFFSPSRQILWQYLPSSSLSLTLTAFLAKAYIIPFMSGRLI